MKVSVSLNSIIHSFEKVNLVTTKDGDEYRCSRCGIKGMRIGLSPMIHLTSGTEEKVKYCTGNSQTDFFVGRKVKITLCHAQNPNFKNCTPGSIHSIITPQKGYVNGDDGVWVAGFDGYPVKLLDDEFKLLPAEPKLKRTK